MLLHVGLSIVLCNLNIMASRVDEVDSVLTESRPAVDQLLQFHTVQTQTKLLYKNIHKCIGHCMPL